MYLSSTAAGNQRDAGTQKKACPNEHAFLILSGRRLWRSIIRELFSDLDCSSAVKSDKLLTHVNEVAIVDGSLELSSGNT